MLLSCVPKAGARAGSNGASGKWAVFLDGNKRRLTVFSLQGEGGAWAYGSVLITKNAAASVVI